MYGAIVEQKGTMSDYDATWPIIPKCDDILDLFYMLILLTFLSPIIYT